MFGYQRMEAMVDEQGNVVVSQGNHIDGVSVVSPSQPEGAHSPLTHQVVTTASGQTIALPTGSGGLSIVQVLPNQSVIHHNQQSVIQTTPGTTLQTVQLPKGNVILLNKGTSSVIQTASGGTPIQAVQVLSENSDDGASAEEDSRKRREILARRPSYRKILNDLSSVDQAVMGSEIKDESHGDHQDDIPNTINIGGMRVAVVPAGTIQLAGSQGDQIQGLQTLTMTNAGGGGAGTIVQYAQGQDGQFFVPVTVSAADLQAYQIRTPNSGVVMATGSALQNPQQVAEDASRKRELRLLKNRQINKEAARECRRKKKEYIKCLENRVAVLENQNKALIEELKSLKELYCQKND